MKCKQCQVEKEEDKFYKGSRVCKTCKIYNAKEWKKNNPEKVKSSSDKRRVERHDELLKKEAIYREKNRDRINESATKYRKENRALCIQRSLASQRKNPNRAVKYRDDNSEKCREYYRKYREKNREEQNRKNKKKNKINRIHTTPEGRARKAVYMALKRGELIRLNKCQMCNKECKPQAHHSDYSKPLEVIWVCTICHGGIHRTLNRALVLGVKNLG